MKKLILLLAFFLIAGFCFAEDNAEQAAKPEFFNLEVTIGMPMHWTNSPTPHYDPNEDKFVTLNTAIGVAMNLNFGRTVGLTIDTDFFFGSDVAGHSNVDSTANSLSGFNLFIGPVFYLYSGSILRVPLAIGANLYYWSSDFWAGDQFSGAGNGGMWVKYSEMQIGPAFYLGLQFHFNESLYLLTRTNVAFDLYRWHNYSYKDSATTYVEEKESEFAFGLHVKPTFGIGVKF